MRVAVVGMGVIGGRLADAIEAQPGMELGGVVVRSPGVAVHARADLALYAFDAPARARLSAAGLPVKGELNDLLADVDVVVDAGQGGTGAGRAAHYRSAGTAAVFCGGERDRSLGPLVHSAINYATVQGCSRVRLASCNTTALGRLVAAVGADRIAELTCLVVRCATDTDKAHKGIVNGALFDAGTSHHAAGLLDLVPGIKARSRALTVPMTSGHLIGVELRTTGALDAAGALKRIRRAPRLTVLLDGTHSTADIKAAVQEAGLTRRGDRYDVVVQARIDAPDTLFAWLSLDNEAVTVPETIDALRALSGEPDAAAARARTDKSLPAQGYWIPFLSEET